jgi:hypothetical protein
MGVRGIIRGRPEAGMAAAVFGAAMALGAAAPAWAGAQLVTNGSFEQTSSGSGQMGYNTAATGWTTSGYNFVFSSGSADTTGVTGQYGNLKLWGPNDGSNNGLPASSPDGGNYIGADGAFQVGAITQTISGLTIGQQYTLGFYWAAAQQYSFTGANTEQWQVSLGSQKFSTAVYSNLSEGFSGWMYQTFTYTATATSEVLSFLAIGTPSGQPPFSLLDGVSMQAVPEPPGWPVMLAGLTFFSLLLWRRRRQVRAAAGR